jgi:hypothetical protein
MDAVAFNELALRVIAGEATADERAALQQELASSAGRRDEFAGLELAFEAARLAGAARATAPELPLHRVIELRTAVRRHFGPVKTRKPVDALLDALRWLFAGGGLVGLATLIVLLCLSNRTIEVGSYATDLVRSGGHPLTQADLPTAQFRTFDYDADFDKWQNQPLAWYEHAKIWVDNERDQLHIVKRIGHGEIVSETRPLATSDDPQRAQELQRAQIQQVVQSLSN